MQNRGKLAFRYGSVDQKAFINALYNASEPIEYKRATVQQRLNAQLLSNDEQGFLQTL